MSIQTSSRPRYSPSGYRIRLRTTQNRVLLVEGSSDKRAFQQLFHEARDQGFAEPATGLTIDTAEFLDSPGGVALGNREKVEAVCQGMQPPDAFPHFVGFSDREFRRFDDVALVDQIAGHEIQGRLVWSRGHSTENYFFDAGTLVLAFRAIAATESFAEAVVLFEEVFADLVRLSSAMSLAARDTQRLGLVSGTIDRTIISITDRSVSIDTTAWHRNLMRQTANNGSVSRAVISSYASWEQRLRGADADFLRWTCHGHVGFASLWAGYSRCVLEVSANEVEANRVFRAPADARQDVTADAWARRVITGHADYPREVLAMLQFHKV